MSIDKSQIIPFPLPEALALFIAHQLDTPIEQIGTHLKTPAKALHIQRKRPLGKMILRCLSKTNKPVFVNEGFTIYISVSKNSGLHDTNIPDCRYSFIDFSENEIKEITDVFNTLFTTTLVSFIDGAIFGNFTKKRDRGKFAAIIEFLKNYNLAHDDMAVERYRKLYDREKKANKHLLHRVL